MTKKPAKQVCAKHLPSLAVRSVVTKDSSFIRSDKEDSEQTELMPRLIWESRDAQLYFLFSHVMDQRWSFRL